MYTLVAIFDYVCFDSHGHQRLQVIVSPIGQHDNAVHEQCLYIAKGVHCPAKVAAMMHERIL